MHASSLPLKRGNIYAVPVLHHNIETAAAVCRTFRSVDPDCVAVELAETVEKTLLQAAARLPDIGVVACYGTKATPIYYLAEPGDAAFEGLRCAQEHGRAAFCIDLDVDAYPDIRERLPDPYAIGRLGLEPYWHAYSTLGRHVRTPLDDTRELHMARRLKELSLRYERVLFVGGMAHVARVLELTQRSAFPDVAAAARDRVELYALAEESARELLPDGGYLLAAYEESRCRFLGSAAPDDHPFPPDRWQLLVDLYRRAAVPYADKQGIPFAGYHLRNLVAFAKKYALVTGRLTPTLFQLLTAAKGCVDPNYAYEVWCAATSYPWLRNIDNRPEIRLSVEEMWGASQKIRFQLKQKNPKSSFGERWRKEKANYRFRIREGAPGFCSYQPEDVAIENFGLFLKKKGVQLLRDASSRTLPFTSSLEDGIDMRETLRHWYDHQLYVKVSGKPPGNAGSVVVIFDADQPAEGEPASEKYPQEKYPWMATWHGEHHQESDMAFYASAYGAEVVGPGICRCSYGGFMLTYPPRRVWDVWTDTDYAGLPTKSEVLLAAAIDYALTPTIVYVALTPPRSLLKNYARRFGKKVAYIPLGQLAHTTLSRLRTFHVLESRDRRSIADEYIF